tara:strand:- start:36 stop:392 length:357 start_codon:yes stop_codon:yes gene_type:complete
MKSNKIQHTKKALLEALEKSLGVVTTACKQVGIDRTTFYRYYKNDSRFRKKVNELSDVAKDFAESQLFKQIQDGNPTATIFYLKTKAKDRGYVERQEIEHTGDVKTEIVQWKPAEKKS